MIIVAGGSEWAARNSPTAPTVHLDGFITGKGSSARHEIFHFTERDETRRFKHRFTDQPNGRFRGTVKVDVPILTNLCLDPFERTGISA
jgi:hypothetical protein